jgi:hypothetical protein
LFISIFKANKGQFDGGVYTTVESNCSVLAQVLQRRLAPAVASEAITCLTAMFLAFHSPCALLSSMTALFISSVKQKAAPLSVAMDSLRVLFSPTRIPFIGSLRALLSDLLCRVLQLCLEVWTTSPMDEEPDTPISAFGLLQEAEQNLPGVIADDVLEKVLDVAAGPGLYVQHRDVAKAILSLLAQIVVWAHTTANQSMAGGRSPRFRELIFSPWGCLLFHRLLRFLFRPPSRSLLPEVVECLWSLRMECGELRFSQWLETVLADNSEFPRNNSVKARARKDLTSPNNHNKPKFKKLLKALCGGKLSD